MNESSDALLPEGDAENDGPWVESNGKIWWKSPAGDLVQRTNTNLWAGKIPWEVLEDEEVEAAGFKRWRGSGWLTPPAAAYRRVRGQVSAAWEAELHRRSLTSLKTATRKSTTFLVGLVDDDQQPVEVRLRAAVEVLDRGGLPKQTKQDVAVTVPDWQETAKVAVIIDRQGSSTSDGS